MQTILIVFLCILLFILLITFPLPFDLRLSFNLFKDNGTVSVYFFGLKLILTKITLEDAGIVIIKRRRKKEEEHIATQKEIIFTNNLISNIYSVFAMRNLYIAYRLGFGDLFYTAILAGSVESLMNVMLINLKNKKVHSEITLASSTDYYSLHIALACKMRFFISIYDVIKSVFLAKIKTDKEIKYGRYEQQNW